MAKKTATTPKTLRITTPAMHRSVLMHCVEALLERTMSVAAANAVAGLSGEIHKSLVLEWEYRRYLAEEVAYEDAMLLLLPLIEGEKG